MVVISSIQSHVIYLDSASARAKQRISSPGTRVSGPPQAFRQQVMCVLTHHTSMYNIENAGLHGTGPLNADPPIGPRDSRMGKALGPLEG
eukprot:8398550-Pyramimonas_sp.AAC.1